MLARKLWRARVKKKLAIRSEVASVAEAIQYPVIAQALSHMQVHALA